MDSNASVQFEQPEKVIEKQELKKILEEVLETLTENEKKVIVLYYYEDLTLKEISKVLEVSESRVSQLHTKAVSRLRANMSKYHLSLSL